MASMSHPPLYGLLHPRPGRWIKGRPRAVAPGAVILQHHFFGASALAPYGGHWHPPGPFYQIGGWAIPFHTGPNLFGAPLQNQQGNGHFMHSPAPPRQAGPGPLKYNGLPRGDITREAFIYHPRPKNHQVGEWYTHYAGRLVSTAREISLLAYDSIRPCIYCQALNIIWACIYPRTVIYSMLHSPINRTKRTLRTLGTMRLPSLRPPGPADGTEQRRMTPSRAAGSAPPDQRPRAGAAPPHQPRTPGRGHHQTADHHQRNEGTGATPERPNGPGRGRHRSPPRAVRAGREAEQKPEGRQHSAPGHESNPKRKHPDYQSINQHRY